MPIAVKTKKTVKSAIVKKPAKLVVSGLETITLAYKKSNPIAQKTLEYILSLGVFEVNVKHKSAVYKSVESGLKDVKDMLDGKKPEKSLKQFLNEV